MTKDTDRAFEEQTRKTGSPHGVMPADELVVACTTKWEQIRTSVPIEDRQEFEPYLEALLGRVATSPESAKLIRASS